MRHRAGVAHRGTHRKEKPGEQTRQLGICYSLLGRTQTSLRKSTWMAHCDNVQEIPEGNLPSILTEELGKVRSARRGNLQTDSVHL